MKKLLYLLFIVWITVPLQAQQPDEVTALRKKIDSLEQRLDEKNYTRIPNTQLDAELNTKVKEQVNGWFSNNFLVGGGILAAIVTVVLTIGRRLITKELNDKLKSYVDDKTKDIGNRFEEHRKTIKEDFKDLKETINNKLTDTHDDIKKSREDITFLFEKFKTETETSFNRYVDTKMQETGLKIDELQTELNETVNPLFNQSVEAILQRPHTTKSEKDEELIKYLEKLFKKGKLPSEKSAGEALDAIITYYYYQLNTNKIIQLINDYGSKYNLNASSYANAGLAFLDKYESTNQTEYHDSCIYYCNESIKKSYNYGFAYTVLLFVYSIDYMRPYTDQDKEKACNEIKQIFHKVKFIKSKDIAKGVVNTITSYKESYVKEYIENVLEKYFANDIQELKQKAEATESEE